MKRLSLIVFVLLWFTGLFIWGVQKISQLLDQPRAVNIPNLPIGTIPITQQTVVVPVGNNTVWAWDRSSNMIEVLKYDGTKFTSELMKINP